LADLKKDIAKLERAETEDIGAAFRDLEIAKKKLADIEKRLVAQSI
jgi:hypothetical protein